MVGQYPNYNYFNSIKVQLEPGAEEAFLCDGVFQFHKGTIRTVSAGRGI